MLIVTILNAVGLLAAFAALGYRLAKVERQVGNIVRNGDARLANLENPGLAAIYI